MIVTVDIGNSRIKWASWIDGAIAARAAAAYSTGNCVDTFEPLFAGLSLPVRVYAVCVAGEKIERTFTEWVRQHWHLDVDYLKTAKKYKNIVNAYADPGQYGADRWATVVAAHKTCPGVSVCVIGAGTAITFDMVNATGRHLGGYIIPSYAIMRDALMQNTAGVESTFHDGFASNKDLPDNTSDAVNLGLHRLLQAGIRDICENARNKLGDSMQIIITGGSARVILNYPDLPEMRYEPDLVMQGLYEIMNNKNNKESIQ